MKKTLKNQTKYKGKSVDFLHRFRFFICKMLLIPFITYTIIIGT